MLEFANSIDLDEVLLNVPFHMELQYLLFILNSQYDKAWIYCIYLAIRQGYPLSRMTTNN